MPVDAESVPVSASGSCLCGAVRYRVHGALRPVVYCHCTQCRKAQGSAFAASVPVARADFELVSGLATLKAYRASPDKARWFCGECGSPIYSALDGGGFVRIRAGTLDDPVDLRPSAHIFTSNQASWFEITDGLPRFPEREPGR